MKFGTIKNEGGKKKRRGAKALTYHNGKVYDPVKTGSG